MLARFVLPLSLSPVRHALACARSEGGFFKAIMMFPQDYPNMPPTLKITSDFWHPNVYPDGRVCISCAAPLTALDRPDRPAL